MKKAIIFLSLLLLLAVTYSCKEKRCVCTYTRSVNSTPGAPLASRALEPLGDAASCADLNRNFSATDSSGALVKVECVPE